ncbi:hypothetical protein RV07_GL001568 [Enterococcus malodoratus]|nr:hypothetical protein RV07_GL001568 [Enterococcus malodoratus]
MIFSFDSFTLNVKEEAVIMTIIIAVYVGVIVTGVTLAKSLVSKNNRF